MMNRRNALKSVALLMGGTVIGAQAFLTSCRNAETASVNALFTADDVAVLDEIGEIIIPTTDTPGAKSVQIGQFMAMMVLDCYTEQDQQAFTEGLSKLQADYKTQYRDSFMEGNPTERTAFVTALDKEMVEHSRTQKQGEPTHYFRIMKELTLLGYFSSEVGATKALRYIETPGRYEGCIDYKKGDRAWAV